jgi:hypothetical protein
MMNERINELFEQAAKEFSTEHKYATYIVPNPLKEKFAELIMRECRPWLADDAFEEVKKHFGLDK